MGVRRSRVTSVAADGLKPARLITDGVRRRVGRSPGRLMVWSPRKRRRAMLRRYQALGKARISLSRLMSYLKEAEPMSHTATGEGGRMQRSDVKTAIKEKKLHREEAVIHQP